jgi:hypothetical protein
MAKVTLFAVLSLFQHFPVGVKGLSILEFHREEQEHA